MKKILIIVSAALVLVLGCKKDEMIQPLSISQVEALKYLPEESQIIIYLNINELRKTDFWENYFKSSLLNYDQNNWLNRFESRTGAGLDDGISQVFISSGKNYLTAGILKFDKKLDKIKNHFENRENYRKEIIKGKSIYTLKGDFPVKFYFINDSSLLVANSKKYIESVIERKNSSLEANGNFRKIINDIRNKNQYWIAADKGTYLLNSVKKFFDVNGNIPVNSVVRSVKGATLSIKFDKGIDIESRLNCKDSKNAYLLSTAIKGALALDLLSGGDYSLGRILQKTEVETSNSKVNLQLELKGNEINTLKNFANKRNIESGI